MATIDELTQEIRELGDKLGIHPTQVDKAIATRDKPQLRAMRDRWKKAHNYHSQKMIAETNRREANQRALVAESKHQLFRAEEHKKLQQKRQKMSLADRLKWCQTKMSLLESKASTSTLQSSRGGEEPVGPPGAFQNNTLFDQTPLRMILAYVEELESQVDAVTGVGPLADRTTPEARGMILDSLAGVHSKDVGAYFNYSQRTIEVWRVERAKERGETISPSTGLPR